MPTVAVVNDDRSFLMLMEELLRDEGFEVLAFHEGAIAYDNIKKAQPDLVILDLKMEEPDTGWQTVQLLCLDPETVHIPLIVCTAALQEVRDKRAWLEQHQIGAIVKPFDVDDLITAVRSTLATREPSYVGLDVA
ncbi:MAG TPA: response regulator [Chloroflexota bacterium]|nr:response regulator [Chloroflexota bacterium]